VNDAVRASAELNALRTARHHLRAQVEAGVDTRQATVDQARAALEEVEARFAELEPVATAMPGNEYLSARVPVPQSAEDKSNDVDPKEGDMAKKSKAAQLEETLVALRKAEKSAGSTKWALQGAGSKANPPSKEKKAHLTAKLEGEQARVAELRAQRDALKA